MAKKIKKYSSEDIKEELIEYAKSSLEMEEKREKNILNQSNSNLTVISILIIAVLTSLFELIDRLQNVSLLLIIFGLFLVLILLFSMFFTMKTQWFYKRAFKRTAFELLEHINTHMNAFSTKDAFQDQMISDISAIQISLSDNNEKRIRDILASSVCLYLFLFFVLIFGISILIIL